jgi:hypothetical protein
MQGEGNMFTREIMVVKRWFHPSCKLLAGEPGKHTEAHLPKSTDLPVMPVYGNWNHVVTRQMRAIKASDAPQPESRPNSGSFLNERTKQDFDYTYDWR